MRTKLRSRISLLFMALALMLAIPATAALAAELVTAELAGAQNKVTVEQGKSANFDINLKGEGAMSCEITQAKPSTAKVINSYSITKASAANSDSTKRVLAGSTFSAAQNFWNDGSECSKTNNSPITWTGAPNGYNVPASISVASDVPVGTYTIGLSPANSTTQITNPTVSKGAILEDKQVTTLTFEVVAPPPPADTSAPVVTPNIQGLLGDNDWYVSDVLLSWTVVDNESAISSKSGCDNVSIITDQNATTYTCEAKSAGGTSTKSVTIKRDATAPEITGADVNNTTWRNSDLSQGFTASDAMSGLANSADGSFTLTASAESGSASTPTTVSKTVKDAAGNSSTRTLSALIDKTAPVISGADVNDTTWRNTNLSKDFTASDSGGSGLANSADASFTLTVSQESPNANTPVSDSRTVYDVAGNSAKRSISAFIDKTKPVISYDGVKGGTLSLNGWYVSAVTAGFKAEDALSGLYDANQASFTQSSGTAEGSAVTINSNAVVKDKAGNVADNVDSVAFKIDLSNPLLNVSGAADGAVFNVCDSGPSRPSFSPFDAISGLDGTQADSWTIPSAASGVGKYVYKADAKDLAGRAASETRTYTKTYGATFYNSGGVLQPINGGTTADLGDDSSRFKLGSTVPVKFKLMCGTTPIDNAVANLNVKKADSTPDPGVDEAISTAASTTGNLFRYDATNQQYIFNLSTKSGYTNPNGTTVSFAAGTYTLSVLLDDGTFRSVNIHIVK